MRAHEKWSHQDWKHIGDKMFDRMSINRCNADRSSPFMVNLVNVFINSWVMKQSEKETDRLNK